MERKISFEQRLQQLEDREAIKALIARYGLVMDDRDSDATAKLVYRRCAHFFPGWP